MDRLLGKLLLWLIACVSAAADDAPVYSVFGDTFPEVQQHQVLIHRHIYLACLDTEARQPAWVAYRVKHSDWETGNVLERNFGTPKELSGICLEPSDYQHAPYQIGHLYGLQFVSARQDAWEVNQMCAVAAQRADLNTGPWLKIENRIKKRSESNTVTVIAGQLWRDKMPPLPNADEPHKVGSHFWIILSDCDGTEAYLLPQSAGRKDDPDQYRTDPGKLREQVAPRWFGGM